MLNKFWRPIKTSNLLIILIIGLIALAIRITGIKYGLPNLLWTSDEGFVIPKVVRIGVGELNPLNFMWPHFFYYLLFGFLGIYFVFALATRRFHSLAEIRESYFYDHSLFYQLGRLFSTLTGMATCILIYFIGRKAYDRKTGIIAALFLTFNMLHITNSQISIPDITMTFFTTLALFFSLSLGEQGKLRHYLLAGIFAGFAISTKYNAFWVCASIAVASIVFITKHFSKRIVLIHVRNLVLAGAVALVAFFVGTPYALLDWQHFLSDIKYTALISTHEASGFAAIEGIYRHAMGLFLPQSLTITGNLIGLMAILGVILGLIRRRWQDMVLMSFAIPHFIFFAFKTAEYNRPLYFLPALPIFMVFAAVFVVELGAIIKRVSQPIAKYVTPVLTALLLIVPILHAVKHGYTHLQQDTNNMARKWIEDNLPADSKIVSADFTSLVLPQSFESAIQEISNSEEERSRALERAEIYKNRGRKTFFISYLHHGWHIETTKKDEDVDYLPHGVTLMDTTKISLEYWHQRGYEYLIFFKNHAIRYMTKESHTKWPKLYEFNQSVFDKCQLIIEFVPQPLNRPGDWIQIYSLSDLSR